MPGADPAPAARERFVVLDSWRGLAALAVVVRHINGTPWFLSGALHDNLSRAVDFFFVLSGFVIAMSYGDRLARGFSFLRFMVLRCGRVWPLHAAMVLAYLLLETGFWLKGTGGVLAGREPFTGPRDLAALPASLLLVQTWLWPDRDLWNAQSWSISVEIALYLGAALLWRVAGTRANWIGFVLALMALGLLQWIEMPQQMLRGVAGFGLGMACWRVWPTVRELALPRFQAGLLELGLLAVLALWLAESVSLAAMDLLFAAMVLVFAREQGPVSQLLRTAPVRVLGLLSYALYMVHMFVIGRMFDLAALAQGRLGAHWVNAHLGGEDMILLAPAPALLLVGTMLGATLVAAWLAFRLIEWPARDLSRRLAGHIAAQNAAPAHS